MFRYPEDLDHLNTVLSSIDHCIFNNKRMPSFYTSKATIFLLCVFVSCNAAACLLCEFTERFSSQRSLRPIIIYFDIIIEFVMYNGTTSVSVPFCFVN